MPWGDPAAAQRSILDAADRVAAASGAWRLAWCAGAGVIGTSAEALAVEEALFAQVVRGLRPVPHTVFLASSVGGAFASSPSSPPFTEHSSAVATAPYGRAKLAMEAVAAELSARGSRLAVARISSLYGPGQNLAKPQGLVSQLCLSQVTGRPLGIYASLDTLRDYLFAPDAAAMVAGLMDAVGQQQASTTVVKILASGRAVSIAALIGECRRVVRRSPRISFRPPTGHSLDLRVRSTVLTELDALARTTLPAGLAATARDIAARLASGSLSSAMRSA